MYATNFHVSVKIWRICQRSKSNNNRAQKTSTYLKGIIKSLLIKGFLRIYAKIVHVSIKDLCICANNLALKDFVIQNHY